MEIHEETVISTVRYIEYNGCRFYPDQKGYWLGKPKGRDKPVRLHVYVWETERGPIPDGYHVHHIDHNPDHNEIENLQLISKHEHLSYHSNLQDKEWARKNMMEKAIPAAVAWHKSEEGHEWHKEQWKISIGPSVEEKVERVCQFCGNTYLVPKFCAEGSRFCSNNCKSAWRRKAGLDNCEVNCEICGKPFVKNKYSLAKFCSDECRNKARQNYWEEKRKLKNTKDVVSES